MADYTAVEKALSEGADPALLCGTCPWDRYCITPPTMTKAEVDAKIAEATKKDEEQAREAQARGERGSMPMGTLLTAMTLGGRHMSATVCPVFALRLRSSAGQALAMQTKETMIGWDDQR